MTASRHVLAMSAVLLVSPHVARGQAVSQGSATTPPPRFEAGPIGGVACTGSEGSSCGGGSGLAVLGGYGSVWLTPRFELQARVTRFARPANASTFTVLGSVPALRVTLAHAERSRTLATGQLLYHFGGQPFRWFAGLGYGVRRDRHRTLCVPAACAALPAHLLGGSRLGRVTYLGPNLALTTGVYGRFRSRWIVRSALTLHNWPAESLSSTEFTMALGVRF